jgi:hypothetical protein
VSGRARGERARASERAREPVRERARTTESESARETDRQSEANASAPRGWEAARRRRAAWLGSARPGSARLCPALTVALGARDAPMRAHRQVCLSLLGTWQGDSGEVWNRDSSTVLQARARSASRRPARTRRAGFLRSCRFGHVRVVPVPGCPPPPAGMTSHDARLAHVARRDEQRRSRPPPFPLAPLSPSRPLARALARPRSSPPSRHHSLAPLATPHRAHVAPLLARPPARARRC